MRALLAPAPKAGAGTPILSSLQVAPGFEAALGAAFGDELMAPLVEGAGPRTARFWLELAEAPDAASLPGGARPLAETVTAPPALARSLGQTGWVDSEAAGHALQPRLAPGQRLVDRDGRLWRWDGFTALAAGPSPAAEQLRHRNRLALLDGEIAAAEAERASAAQNVAAGASRTPPRDRSRQARPLRAARGRSGARPGPRSRGRSRPARHDDRNPARRRRGDPGQAPRRSRRNRGAGGGGRAGADGAARACGRPGGARPGARCRRRSAPA